MQVKKLISCLIAACALTIGAAQAEDFALAQTSGTVGIDNGNVGVIFHWNGFGDDGPWWSHRPPPPPAPPPQRWHQPPPPPPPHVGPPPPPKKGWGPPYKPPKHKDKRHPGHR